MTQLTHSLRTGSSQTALLTSISRLLVRGHERLSLFQRICLLVLDAVQALVGSDFACAISSAEDAISSVALKMTAVASCGCTVLLAKLLLILTPENSSGRSCILVVGLLLTAITFDIGKEGGLASLHGLILHEVVSLLGAVASVERVHVRVAHRLQSNTHAHALTVTALIFYDLNS